MGEWTEWVHWSILNCDVKSAVLLYRFIRTTICNRCDSLLVKKDFDVNFYLQLCFSLNFVFYLNFVSYLSFVFFMSVLKYFQTALWIQSFKKFMFLVLNFKFQGKLLATSEGTSPGTRRSWIRSVVMRVASSLPLPCRLRSWPERQLPFAF